MDLRDLGWDELLQRRFEERGEEGLVPARVVRVDRGALRLLAAQGEVGATVPLRLGGADLDAASRPVVGDWCAVRLPAGDGPTLVEAVLPRKTAFSRKAAGRATAEQVVAANVDVAFLVTDPSTDFSLRRLERLLTLTWDSGARPAIVLNKIDFDADIPARLEEIESVALGVSTLAVSAVTGEGIDRLHAEIGRGQTVVFLGSSGVGKSTLINRLLGAQRLRTAEVVERDGRGKHTTTRRELVVLAKGGVVIDTPGIREVGMWATEEALDTTFQDIAELAAGCRFADCSHGTEPGCAVVAAVERGDLPEDRLRSFHRLGREIASTARRADEHLRREHERKTYGRYRYLLRRRRKLDG